MSRHSSLIPPRQRETLYYICLGLTNSEIAQEMGIDEVTVKTYIRHLLRSLNVNNRTQLTLHTIFTGLIPLEELKKGYEHRQDTVCSGRY